MHGQDCYTCLSALSWQVAGPCAPISSMTRLTESVNEACGEGSLCLPIPTLHSLYSASAWLSPSCHPDHSPVRTLLSFLTGEETKAWSSQETRPDVT